MNLPKIFQNWGSASSSFRNLAKIWQPISASWFCLIQLFNQLSRLCLQSLQPVVFVGLSGLWIPRSTDSAWWLHRRFKMNHPRFFQDFFYQQYDDNMFWGEICLHHVGWKSCNIIQYAQGTLPDAPGQAVPLLPPLSACPSAAIS